MHQETDFVWNDGGIFKKVQYSVGRRAAKSESGTGRKFQRGSRGRGAAEIGYLIIFWNNKAGTFIY